MCGARERNYRANEMSDLDEAPDDYNEQEVQNNEASNTDVTKSKIKKKQRKVKKKKNIVKPAIEIKAPRDFESDLIIYLQEWNNRNNSNSNWKFSKVLQSWSIQNCFHNDKITENTFNSLLSYITTIQGAARQRLIDLSNQHINTITTLESDSATIEPTADEVVISAEGTSTEVSTQIEAKPVHNAEVHASIIERANKILEVLEES